MSGWNVIHYFLKEICGFDIDETQAKSIAATFKKQVYNIPFGASPSALLIEIAEGEYGLKPINVPEQFRGAIAQNLTDTTKTAEIGEVTHASGVILRSKR